MILFLDNRDSFVYNLARYVRLAGKTVDVIRSDHIDIAGIAALNPEAIVISPGPSGPLEAGISVAAIQHFSGQIPLLGVCLGHQAIGAAFGGKIARAQQPMHGRASLFRHDGDALFRQLPQQFSIGRYHSLIVGQPLPVELRAIGWSAVGEIMALRHQTHLTFGVQFHPESILTEHGMAIIRNFLELAK
jgi:para-aminobenzoate synthetase component II